MMETENNVLKLCGVIESAPVLDHEVFGEQFYRMELKVPRLSGTYDLLPVTVSERLIEGEVAPGMQIGISGQLRSYNKVIGGSGRLLLTAFAQQLETPDETQNPNTVQLVGAICKPPSFRTTPFGREIADLMLAVNRSFGKSDYIPCIAWGRNARYLAEQKIGTQIELSGRIQSREYVKRFADYEETRTAYEVSVAKLEIIKEAEVKEETEKF